MGSAGSATLMWQRANAKVRSVSQCGRNARERRKKGRGCSGEVRKCRKMRTKRVFFLLSRSCQSCASVNGV